MTYTIQSIAILAGIIFMLLGALYTKTTIQFPYILLGVILLLWGMDFSRTAVFFAKLTPIFFMGFLYSGIVTRGTTQAFSLLIAAILGTELLGMHILG